MATKKITSSDESENDKMLSTDCSSPEREKQKADKSDGCCSNGDKQNKEQKVKKQCQSSSQKIKKKDDCCSIDFSKKQYICFGMINISPIANAYQFIMITLYGQVKNYFYFLMLTLYPSTFYRYFIRLGFTPFNDFTVLLKMVISLFFMMMAFWSHSKAGPDNDPGYLEWDHFRTEENRIKNEKDRQKWVNGIACIDEKKEEDQLKNDTYPMQCDKCGTLKVLGVHHCGKCNKCVYKMDHHCPWTNNCVGYMTLKPFILFLFYVTAACSFIVGCMYRQAWVLRMQHISMVQTFIPAYSNVKYLATMYYLNETERAEVRAENQIAYDTQVAFEKANPDVFSRAFFYDFFINWKFTKYYFLYSWETFWDFFVIILTLACGLYTLGLMYQTLNFAKHETSMIDDMKIKVYMKNRRTFKKELMEYMQKNKRRKTLTWQQLWELVFGESTLLCFHTWIPVYRKPRSIQLASEEYLANEEQNEKKIQ